MHKFGINQCLYELTTSAACSSLFPSLPRTKAATRAKALLTVYFMSPFLEMVPEKNNCHLMDGVLNRVGSIKCV